MKKGFYFALCMMLCVTLSGCWSRYEPKTLALINSAIYDLSDTGGYQVTIEAINPAAQGGSTNGGGGKNPTIIAFGQGSSIPEAIRNISESLERTVFAGHVQVRFFSERFVQKDIDSAMDYIMRDYLTDANALIVVIQNEDSKQIYSCMLGLSEHVGDYITAISDTQPGITSKSVFVKTLDFVKDYYKEGKQPVAGVVRLVENEANPSQNAGTGSSSSQDSKSQQGGSDKNYRIIYGGLAAFKDGKLAGYMNEVEARAYNFITNNLDRAIITIGAEDSQTAVIVHNSKAEVKTKIENGQVTVNVKIKTYMDIVQENSPLDINKSEVLKKIEADFNKQMVGEIAAAIKKAQTEFESDIFGFGVSMHKQHPQEWKAIKGNWDDYFANAVINISVESTIDRQGESKQPFRWETGK